MIQPIAIYDPTSELLLSCFPVDGHVSPVDRHDSPVREKSATNDDVLKNHYIVHTDNGGVRLLCKDKWPVLSTPHLPDQVFKILRNHLGWGR